MHTCKHTDVGDTSSSSNSGGGGGAGNGSGNGSGSITSLHIESTARQLVEIAAVTATNEWMVTLLRDVLHGKGEGEEAAEQVRVLSNIFITYILCYIYIHTIHTYIQSLQTYLHTYIYIYTYIHTYIHTYHTYIHYIHTYYAGQGAQAAVSHPLREDSRLSRGATSTDRGG